MSHVILLGFVKCFWRDAISRLNDIEKAQHQVRLASVGLGIPPSSNRTLAQYAGSLTGHDFWVISQAAPFVLYDLVPRQCYETFVALSTLVPLVWQPCINNLEQHLVCTSLFLTDKSNQILGCLTGINRPLS